MKTNYTVTEKKYTHEGGKAANISKLNELKRSLLTCMLWEDGFYEEGEMIADRIKRLAKEVDYQKAEELTVQARSEMNLRHAPLWMVVSLLEEKKNRARIKNLIQKVVQRPDEMGELISLYWLNAGKKVPLAASLKKGLAECFHKFNEYSLAKNDKNKAAIKLRDVMFMVHPKPVTADEKVLFEKIANNNLAVPETWETMLSSGMDKKETFEKLMAENKLGGLAFLRNLRNMKDAGINKKTVEEYFDRANFSRVFPYRFIAAANSVPGWEDIIDKKFIESAQKMEKLPGKTVLLVDVSGSMDWLSRNSMSGIDIANGLSMIFREICEDVQIFTFSNRVVEVPLRRGFSLCDAIKKSQEHGGTRMGMAISEISARIKADRLIVITDEQSSDRVNKSAFDKSYIINIDSNENGVNYADYVHINGFSESVVRFLMELEKLEEESA